MSLGETTSAIIASLKPVLASSEESLITKTTDLVASAISKILTSIPVIIKTPTELDSIASNSTSSTHSTSTSNIALPSIPEAALAKALLSLKLLHGSGAKPKTSVQLDALALIISNEKDLIVVDGTNGGKSSIFYAYSLLNPTKKILVFYPILSLEHDAIKKAIEFGIPSLVPLVWNSDPSSSNSNQLDPPSLKESGYNLIFAQVDSLNHSGFAAQVKDLDRSGDLGLIVLDEAHLAASQENWREVMVTIGNEFRQLTTKKLFLSATIPTSYHPTTIITTTSTPSSSSFLNKFFLHPTSTITIRNSFIRRSELHYFKLEIELSPQFLLQLVQKYVLNEKDRVIIFVPTIKRGKELARKVNCKFYDCTLSPESRRRMKEDWEAGGIEESPIIIATGQGFGTGVSIGSVRVVVYARREIESLVDTVQYLSRAGRHGLPALALLVTDDEGCGGDGGGREAPMFVGDLEAATAYATSKKTCRRAVLEDLVNDTRTSIPLLCLREGLSQCDHCHYTFNSQ